MYEYLIRDLRDPNMPIDCNEVADAIEELNRIIYLLKSDRVTPKVCCDCWLDWLKQEAGA